MPQAAKRELQVATLALSAMLATRKYSRSAQRRCAKRLDRALEALKQPTAPSPLVGTVTPEMAEEATAFAMRGCRICPVFMSCKGRI